MKRKAFTLIELLVVVAIIGILAAVGVVAYNGYTSATKIAVKTNSYMIGLTELYDDGSKVTINTCLAVGVLKTNICLYRLKIW